jgi:tetratricopeptide (TPR) repeat protein
MKPRDFDEEMQSRTIARIEAMASQIHRERDGAPERLTELLTQPPSERFKAIVIAPRFQTYSLALHILERSERLIFHHPRAALELTRLARAVTIQIDPQTCGGPASLADLGAYVFAREGNAQRVCGEMAAALTCFARARELQKRGGVDSHLTAQIDLMDSSLRRDLGQLHTALHFLDRAAESFLALGEHERLIQAQINRSNIFLVQDEAEQAAGILEDLLGKTTDPQSILTIQHNLLWLLTRSGRPCDAAQQLQEWQGLYRAFSDPLIRNRRTWLEGMIACGLGENRLARNLLNKAGADLAERGYAFDAALVRLDLGRLQARWGAEPVC